MKKDKKWNAWVKVEWQNKCSRNKFMTLLLLHLSYMLLLFIIIALPLRVLIICNRLTLLCILLCLFMSMSVFLENYRLWWWKHNHIHNKRNTSIRPCSFWTRFLIKNFYLSLFIYYSKKLSLKSKPNRTEDRGPWYKSKGWRPIIM